jgi:hypothetical protein
MGAMPNQLKILCFHGLGDHRSSNWEQEWQDSVEAALDPAEELELLFEFPTYDPIFETVEISFGEAIRAFWKLAKSGVSQLDRKHRGFFGNISERLRWTAGYVVAWVEYEGFQRETRKFVLNQVKTFKPDLILAHSLGSLVTYNALTHPDAKRAPIARLLADTHYVTLGSQIGNPFVIGNLTFGRVQQPAVRFWHHLFNRNDDLFTAPLKVQGVDTFQQLQTPFDLPGRGDHDARGYFAHQVTRESLWRPLARRFTGARALASPPAWGSRQVERPKRRKALLVGINQYPNAADRLDGCINDVFTMSAVLQECGFRPEDIRTLFDNRASGAGILERLEWLVEDARAGDELVFYYSGHGARVPEYGEFMEPDRLTETLVPWDFDWTPERGVSDEQLYALYSQLPYETRLMMIFDCCHSGGMHRQSGAKARGISPPDDIRHRELKWDVEAEMWVDRSFERLNSDFAPGDDEATRAYFGSNGATVRLGRAAMLRTAPQQEYKKAAAKADEPVGPFLPLIIQACEEGQLSYEYRHGATSYGAFTFCLASILRKEPKLTFEQLVERVGSQLAELGYQQTPAILGPSAIREAPVPFRTGTKAGQVPGDDQPGAATPRTSG